jgi:DNA-binding MarR family transcriptional regulator
MSDLIGTLLADVSRLMRRNFDEKARSIGVTRPQWRVLTTLNRHEGINQGGLADLLDVEPISVGRMVDRLCDAGLVERQPDPADRRIWRLYLTKKAGALLEDLRPLAIELFEEALGDLSSAERDQLHSMLERIRANLTRRTTRGLVANG